MKGAAIIQDLLTLARRGVSISQVVQLNEVVSEYLASPEFEKLQAVHPLVRFHSEQAKDLLPIKGSPVHLGKTVMNLVANAAEAIAGRGEVTLRTENRYLDRPVGHYDDLREGDYAVLTVADTGQGIAPGDLEKIFEPFYTKKVMGRSGTGLGLAVVWGTVKDHGGYIDVTSQEGEGSLFSLYFPVTREALAPAQAPRSLASYQGRGERILVVDDVPEQREVAVSMLTRLGYRVEAVAGGREALAYLAAHPVDLVVLDMILDPEMDGLEAYQRMVALRPGLKAVIVSGFSETDRVWAAQALGAGAYVRKPYVLERIGTAIRAELDRQGPGPAADPPSPNRPPCPPRPGRS
jgi:CheY-like chemotaxis protein